jgi:hypothetical protein
MNEMVLVTKTNLVSGLTNAIQNHATSVNGRLNRWPGHLVADIRRLLVYVMRYAR